MRAVIITGSLLALTVLLMLGGYANDFWDLTKLSLRDDFHITVLSHGTRSALSFYNDAEYGIYQGSIISLEGANDIEVTREFGRIAGIYYRYFKWFDGNKLWTLTVSMWWPAGIFGSMFAIAAFREYRRRNASPATIDQPPTDQ